jgi:HEAT repeat protein
MLTGLDEEAREDCVDALFRLHRERAAEHVVGLARKADPWLRLSYLDLLIRNAPERSFEIADSLLSDGEEEVREATLLALARCSSPS